MTEKIVTREDRGTITLLGLAAQVADLTVEERGRVDEFLKRTKDAAEADQPPLPVKVPLLYTGSDGDQAVFYAQPCGTVTTWRDGGYLRGYVAYMRDRLTPLRPTVTEADVEKAARAARAAFIGSDNWDAANQDVRDGWMKATRAALDALDIEVRS